MGREKMKWTYGDAYKRHPVEGVIVFDGGSKLAAHDIFDHPLPNFMKEADLLFIDPPWNLGNLNTFYTKAGRDHRDSFGAFYRRLFECIGEIDPRACYIEVGKQHLADFILEMRRLFRQVTFYNSTYYRSKDKLCYVIRGAQKRATLPLDYMDEEDIIARVCANEDYSCIGDLCMGLGLVGWYAYQNGRRFVGTDLNHRRLSVLVERLADAGCSYRKEALNCTSLKQESYSSPIKQAIRRA